MTDTAEKKFQREVCDALETETTVIAECFECGNDELFQDQSDWTVAERLVKDGWRVVDCELRCPECVNVVHEEEKEST